MALIQDLRFAVRILVKDRWFTLLAVVALALGIGMNAAVFTFVNAVLLRGLPYAESHRIMHVNSRNTARGGGMPMSYPDFQDFRAQTQTFQELTAFRPGTMNVSDVDRLPERYNGAWVAANTFRILGQPMHLGRDFRPDEDQPGAAPVAIIGFGTWQTRYGGDPNILGRAIKINENPATIVGVMARGVGFPNNAAVWQPLVPNAQDLKRDNRSVSVLGRLKTGVTEAEARAELTAIAARLRSQYPDVNKDVDVEMMAYNDRVNGGPIRVVFLALMGAVGFVLLIACANVANLLLSRAAHRAREIAVRTALGASRWRIVRQLLVESVLLSCLGGLFGLGLAYIGVRLFDAATSAVALGRPYWIVFNMDARVLAFFAGICVLTGILFGLAPALQASKTNVSETLNEGGRSGTSGRRARRFSAAMVVAQVALTVVLLVGAGLMMRSFLKLYTLDLGVDTDRLITMRLVVAERKYPKPDDRHLFTERLIARLASAPGLKAAAVATSVPLTGGPTMPIEFEGRPAPEAGQQAPEVTVVMVSPGYFDALGLPLRRGRGFTEQDGAAGSETVIVSERLVARFFPNEDPIGRRIRLRTQNRDRDGDGKTEQAPWLTIIGISPAVRQRAQQDVEIDAVAYVPFRYDPGRAMSLIARADGGNPASLATLLREEVRAVDADQPVFNVFTMNEVLANQRWPYRVFGSMFAIFAVIALILSSVGIYAVSAYAVTQRTQEIGVRMALGAQGRQVSWLILRQGLLQLAIGAAIGVTGAYFVSAVLRALLVQITARDPVTFATITVLLVAVMTAACLIPARRATRLDPLAALRVE